MLRAVYGANLMHEINLMKNLWMLLIMITVQVKPTTFIVLAAVAAAELLFCLVSYK